VINDNTFAFGFLVLCLEEKGYSIIKACIEGHGWRNVAAPEAYGLFECGEAMYFAFYNADKPTKGVMSSIVVGLSKRNPFIVAWQPKDTNGYETVQQIIPLLEKEGIEVATQKSPR
jgi:hypothetical protein